MEHLEELVAQFIERREAGELISAEEFASGHPAHSKEILAALREVQKTEQLLRDPSLPTERLGPYRLLALIGSGGMGRVYRAAHDDRPDEELALKLLSPQMMNNETARLRFDREARALVKLDHPGVVKVLDHGLVDGIPYLAMELVRGTDLVSLLDEARGRRDQDARPAPCEHLDLAGESDGHRRVAALVAPLARAVQAAHASGVLHRDIKPGNVIQREDASPVLVDFGLARGGGETISLTSTGDLLGTPRYMAPEQARGGETDERTDIHGLGVLLYELLTLEPPHPAGEPMTVLRAVAEQAVPAVIRTDPKVPASLNRIVRRACAFRPASRYATAAELASDLEAFLAQTAVRARNFSPWERLEDAWVLRRKTLVGAVVALIVLGALALLREEPPDFDLLTERAILAYAADDMAGTAAGAQRILTHDPEHPMGRWLEGLAMGVQVQSRSPFVTLLNKGLTDSHGRVWPQAIAAFEDAQRLEPDSPVPRVLLEQTRRLMAQQKAEHGVEMPESASALYELGKQRNGVKKWAEAERALKRAVELDPNHTKAWAELCIAQFYQGRAEDALESAARGGASAGVQYCHTLLLRDQRGADFPHVRAVLAPILQEDPNHHLAARIMGYTYDYEHKIDVAREWYERIVDMRPDSIIDLLSLAFLRTGAQSATCAECARWFRDHPADLDLEEARRLYMRVLKLDQGKSMKFSDACNSLKRLGPTAMAEEFIETLLKKDGGPTDPARHNRLIKALDQLRR